MAVVESKSVASRAYNWGIILFLGLLTVLFLYPLWYVLTSSFSDPMKLMYSEGFRLLPAGFSLKGYEAVLGNKHIWRGYFNTIVIYAGLGTLINMVMTILGAYCLSRDRVMLKKVLTVFIVVSMYVNAGMIPRFLNLKSMGLLDSYWAILLPGALSTYNMIVLRSGFRAVPKSLEEAAQLDGGGHLTILFNVIIPLALPNIMVIMLYYFVGHWNSWFAASIYIKTRDKYPLQLYLREVLITSQAEGGDPSMEDGLFYLDELIRYCTIVVATVPVLCLYPFIQRYFVKGVMVGSLKE